MLCLPLADPFVEFRVGFANFLLAVFGAVCCVALAMAIIFVIQGEKDSAKKLIKWIVGSAVGFILIELIRGL